MSWFRKKNLPTCRLDRAAKVRIFSGFGKPASRFSAGPDSLWLKTELPVGVVLWWSVYSNDVLSQKRHFCS